MIRIGEAALVYERFNRIPAPFGYLVYGVVSYFLQFFFLLFVPPSLFESFRRAIHLFKQYRSRAPVRELEVRLIYRWIPVSSPLKSYASTYFTNSGKEPVIIIIGAITVVSAKVKGRSPIMVAVRIVQTRCATSYAVGLFLLISQTIRYLYDKPCLSASFYQLRCLSLKLRMANGYISAHFASLSVFGSSLTILAPLTLSYWVPK